MELGEKKLLKQTAFAAQCDKKSQAGVEDFLCD